MTPLVWANLPLALLFVLAWAGVPLWMIFKRPDTAPDFSDAYDYLAATRPSPLSTSSNRVAARIGADPERAVGINEDKHTVEIHSIRHRRDSYRT